MPLLATAAAAAGLAGWVELRSRRAEREHPAPGSFVYVDGLRLHYVMRGVGPAVVLLHGNTATWADFEESGLVDALARDHRVIAFDRPGFGHSDRPRRGTWTPRQQARLVFRALLALGIGEFGVLGHSMGAMVGMALALDFPLAVSKAVLVGGYYYPSARWDALFTAPVAWPVVGDAMRYTVTALTARATLNPLVKYMFHPDPVPASYLQTLSRELLLRPLQLRSNAEDAGFMVPQARAFAKRYRSLAMPLTLIAGARDRVVDPSAHSLRLHREVPRSELIVLPGTGHMAHHRAQQQIVHAFAAAPAELAGAHAGDTQVAAHMRSML